MFYVEKYGEELQKLDRGGLKYPTDSSCQWTFFSYTIFQAVRNRVCRHSLIKILMLVAEHNHFKHITRTNARILSNILINNFCKDENPKSTKESSLKVLKLSKTI